MPDWEYQFAPTVKAEIKKHLKGDLLDPTVSDWSLYVDYRGEAPLARGPRGYFTPVLEALNEWGTQGWEVACINDRPNTQRWIGELQFEFVLKRPLQSLE
jgi:hypothetical protein